MYNPFSTWPVSCDFACHLKRGSAGGIDYAVPVGTVVPAICDGTVRHVTNSVGGNIAILTRSDGIEFMFDHLSEFGPTGNVKQGDTIGLTGGIRGAIGAGNSTGPHLHVNAYEKGRVTNWLDYLTTVSSSGSTEQITEMDNDQMKIITWVDNAGQLARFATDGKKLLNITGFATIYQDTLIKVYGNIVLSAAKGDDINAFVNLTNDYNK